MKQSNLPLGRTQSTPRQLGAAYGAGLADLLAEEHDGAMGDLRYPSTPASTSGSPHRSALLSPRRGCARVLLMHKGRPRPATAGEVEGR